MHSLARNRLTLTQSSLARNPHNSLAQYSLTPRCSLVQSQTSLTLTRSSLALLRLRDQRTWVIVTVIAVIALVLSINQFLLRKLKRIRMMT